MCSISKISRAYLSIKIFISLDRLRIFCYSCETFCLFPSSQLSNRTKIAFAIFFFGSLMIFFWLRNNKKKMKLHPNEIFVDWDRWKFIKELNKKMILCNSVMEKLCSIVWFAVYDFFLKLWTEQINSNLNKHGNYWNNHFQELSTRLEISLDSFVFLALIPISANESARYI